MSWVARLEERLQPHLTAIADELAAEFPSMEISVYGGAVGSLTEWQGHDFGVECVFPGVADNVALAIEVAQLTTRPQLTGLHVAWGYPSGHFEISLVTDPVDLDDAALARIDAALPELATALRAAVARGRPR